MEYLIAYMVGYTLGYISNGRIIDLIIDFIKEC